jgi:hypothetical protein
MTVLIHEYADIRMYLFININIYTFKASIHAIVYKRVRA